MSYLITFEGLDYCGKSTQISLLEAHIVSRGRTVHLVREPGGTPIGESIRGLLLDPKNDGLSDAGELFLFSASRADLVASVIRPLLRSGTVVLCDRFYDSTTAYQGGGRGFETGSIDVINMVATGGLIPDATILIDIPVEEMERRMQSASAVRDRMESNKRAFYDRVRDAYLALARSEQRIRVVNGMKPVPEIADEIRHIYDAMGNA
jgi:dTMP kinase